MRSANQFAAGQSSAGADPARFRSEMFVPVVQGSSSAGQSPSPSTSWQTMHERLDQRRKQWNDEVSRMRSDFFQQKPTDVQNASDRLVEKMDVSNMFYDAADGTKVFRVCFDVGQFSPEEIEVKTQDQRLTVHAVHYQKDDDRTVRREFNRQIDIPQNVDPKCLHSTLNKNGVLQVEAEVTAPPYEHVRQRTISSTSSSGSSTGGRGPASPVPGLASASAGRSVTERDGTQTFRISVDVGPEFSADELTVKSVERRLLIHARHDETIDGRTSRREFSREFELPDAVDPETLVASMPGDGRLVIQAPIASYSQGAFTPSPGSSKRPEITVLITP